MRQGKKESGGKKRTDGELGKSSRERAQAETKVSFTDVVHKVGIGLLDAFRWHWRVVPRGQKQSGQYHEERFKFASLNRVCSAMMRDYVCSERWAEWRRLIHNRRNENFDPLDSFLTHGIRIFLETLDEYSSHVGNEAHTPMFRHGIPYKKGSSQNDRVDYSEYKLPSNFLQVTGLRISTGQCLTIRNAIANLESVRVRQVRKYKRGPDGNPFTVFMHAHKQLGDGTWVQWFGDRHKLDPEDEISDKEVEISIEFDVILWQLQEGTKDVCREFLQDVTRLRDAAGAVSNVGDGGGSGSGGGGRGGPSSQFEAAQQAFLARWSQYIEDAPRDTWR